MLFCMIASLIISTLSLLMLVTISGNQITIDSNATLRAKKILEAIKKLEDTEDEYVGPIG